MTLAVNIELPWWGGEMCRIVSGVTSYLVITLYVDDLTPRTIYATYIIYIISCHLEGGVGIFSTVVVTLNHVSGSFNINHRGCLNNPVFSNVRLCAACWARFMSHHELCPISVSQPFSSLSSSLSLAERRHYHKITIPIFRHVLQNFAIPGCFPHILSHRYLFSLLSSGWFVIVVCNYHFIHGSIS